MFTQLNPKERLGYGIFAMLLLAIAAVIGYRFGAHSQGVSAHNDVPAATARTEKPSSTPTEILVHVVGAVHNPGVYHLGPNARALDAVKAAGGGNADSDLTSVNLARKLTDGEQLRIESKSEQAATTSPSPSEKPDGKLKNTKGSGQSVSLNAATVEDLEKLPGVGAVTAQRIIDWRTAHGFFTNLEEFKQVGGIGDKKLARLAPYIHL